MRSNRISSVILGAGLIGLLINPAQAARCAKATEATALRTRMMQTELMVAALSCSQRSEYNAFVTRYRPELRQNGGTLQTYFKRSYGRRGTEELNAFTTRLANEVSKRSLSDVGSFCSEAAKTFATLQTMPTPQFASYVSGRSTADNHGVALCTVEASATPVKHATTHKVAARTKAPAKVQPASVKVKVKVPAASKEKSALTTVKVVPAKLTENDSAEIVK